MPPQNPEAMAERPVAAGDPVRANEIRQAGIDSVRQYTWPNVRARLLAMSTNSCWPRTSRSMADANERSVPLKTDFYTTLVSGVFFPLHELIKKHDTVAIRKEMETSQWWAEERLGQLRLSRLRRLLASAEARVPYYRNLFADIGFKVEDVASLADLARLPLLDKSAIRAQQRCAEGGKCDRPRALQHRRFQRRAAGILYRQGAGQPRRRRQVARDALVERGYRRP